MPYVVDGYDSPGFFSDPLTTRTLNNVAQGFSGISTTLKAGWKILLTLVDRHGRPTSAVDATSGHELVGYQVTATIDPTNGEFTLPLWPTDRAVGEVFYACRVTNKGLDMIEGFVRPFPDGVDAMLFSEFKAQGRWD
jgi:hypothetical protein